MIRGGPGSYKLKLNQSEIEAEIHTLRDGGLLMQASLFSEQPIYLCFCSSHHYIIILDIAPFSVLCQSLFCI
jgi:hypothetical protein